MKYLIVLLLLAAPLAVSRTALAQAAPQNLEDCERIKEDMTYNDCLAKFGPQVGTRIPRINDAGQEVTGRQTARRGGRSRGKATSRGGRQRALFQTRSRRR